MTVILPAGNNLSHTFDLFQFTFYAVFFIQIKYVKHIHIKILHVNKLFSNTIEDLLLLYGKGFFSGTPHQPTRSVFIRHAMLARYQFISDGKGIYLTLFIGRRENQFKTSSIAFVREPRVRYLSSK